MKILRAEHLGMCFGVRDAIALAIRKSRSGPLTVLGDLVHNESVLAGLRTRGVKIAQDAEAVDTSEVMITAHGASERAIRDARTRGFRVTEATCPLVRVAHKALAGLLLEDYHPVIVGLRDHVEVRGMTEDLEACDVILSAEDVEAVRERPRFGVVAQTTQPIEKVLALAELLRRRFPESEVRVVDTVCRPTKQRQQAAVEMACQADVVVVVGGAHSNNTRELVKACSRYCPRVHHVQTSRELHPEWFEGAEVIGLTAGTSTPDASLSEVERWLLEHAASLENGPWTAAGRVRAAA